LPDIDWDDLRYVLAVARARAIAPASRMMRVNVTTVARRILRIEAALGSKLFERRDGYLRPTEMAAHVIEGAEHIEAEAKAVVEKASGADVAASGRVRITSIPLIASRLLLPGVRALSGDHPELLVELIADPRNLSIMQRDADIALRLARPDRDQSAVARRLASLSYAVYAPKRSKASRLPWITYEEGMSHLPHVAWLERTIKSSRGAPALIVNDSEIALHAINHGYGKSLLPCLIADREPGLRRVSGGTPVLQRELWLLVNPSLRHLARIMAVVTWIERLIAAASTSNVSKLGSAAI
jgi:DNA-binding transcriptional LysR family regulator